jgi:hypothetical protein
MMVAVVVPANRACEIAAVGADPSVAAAAPVQGQKIGRVPGIAAGRAELDPEIGLTDDIRHMVSPFILSTTLMRRS